jgi:hypothetical protein
LVLVGLIVFIPVGLLDVVNHHLQAEDFEDLTGIQSFGVFAVGVSQSLTALLGEVLFAGVVAAAVSETEGGRLPSFGQLVRRLPYVTVILITILFSVGLALTLLLLVVPGIFFFAIFVLAAPIAKIEHVGVRASFGRSRQLTRHHGRLVLLVLLPIGIAGQVLSDLAVVGVGDLLGDSFAGEWIGATLSEAVSAPLWALAAVSLTYELIERGGATSASA